MHRGHQPASFPAPEAASGRFEVVMYDPSLQSAVLHLLQRWHRLPLSDLVALLEPLQRPRFREDLLKDMEWEGLVTLHTAGDEQVVTLTPRGQAMLSGPSPTPGPSGSEG